jgi:hypothetical protein
MRRRPQIASRGIVDRKIANRRRTFHEMVIPNGGAESVFSRRRSRYERGERGADASELQYVLSFA